MNRTSQQDEPTIVRDMLTVEQDWQGELGEDYYFKLANGDYDRFDFYLLARNGVFAVHSAVNPTGSRDLEPAY